MPIIRTACLTRYTNVSNAIIESGLSWQALGLLVYVLSKPDHWTVRVNQLRAQVAASAAPAGRDATYNILNELVQAGYVRRAPVRTQSGTLNGWEYAFFDVPQTDSPHTVYPDVGTPCTALPDTDEPDAAQPNTVKPYSLVNTESQVTTESQVNTDSPAKTEASTTKGTRLSDDWTLPEEWAAWAMGEKPDWNMAHVLRVAEGFKDYWIAQPGQKGLKCNWLATWRGWVRRESSRPASQPSRLSKAGESTKAAAAAWLGGEHV